MTGWITLGEWPVRCSAAAGGQEYAPACWPSMRVPAELRQPDTVVSAHPAIASNRGNHESTAVVVLDALEDENVKKKEP